MSDLLDLLDDTMKGKLGLERLLFHARFKVPYHGVSKNRREIHYNRRTKRSFIGKNSRLVFIENYLLQQLRRAAIDQKIDKPYRCAVSVLCLYRYADFKCKNGSLSRHVADLDNLFGIIGDTLQKSGIIYNDRLIYSWDFSRRLPGKENELEIFIREFTEDLSEPE